MYLHTYIYMISKVLCATREVSFYISVAANKALYKVLYLPGHTFGLLLGKLQPVGQEVLLLNLLCSCVWSDLDGVHDANSPDGIKLHCLAHKNKISLRLVNRKIY